MNKQLESDLRFVFGCFPLRALRHVKRNRQRLIRRAYSNHAGGGCLLNLLSELCPKPERIDSRTKLTEFFRGGHGLTFRCQPEYQPAKWLVRHVDGDAYERYDNEVFDGWDTILRVLDGVIAERVELHKQERRVHQAAIQRLAQKLAGRCLSYKNLANMRLSFPLAPPSDRMPRPDGM